VVIQKLGLFCHYGKLFGLILQAGIKIITHPLSYQSIAHCIPPTNILAVWNRLEVHKLKSAIIQHVFRINCTFGRIKNMLGFMLENN